MIGLLCLTTFCLALASDVRMEPDAGVPRTWVQQHRVGLDEWIHLSFFLNLRNADMLERELLSRSDPFNTTMYGKWLSKEETDAMIMPAPVDVSYVQQWLQRETGDAGQVTLNCIKLRVRAPVAEKLLRTTFSLWTHKVRSQVKVVRASGPYYLPSDVAARVAFVGGVKHFPRLRISKKQQPQRSKRLGLAITPRIVHEKYGTGSTKNTAANNSQAVHQFLGQFFWEADLQEFFTLYSQENIGKHPIKVGPDTGFAGGEADLDIEYVMSVGRDVRTYFWSTAGLHGGQEPFLEWITDLYNRSDAPWVNSISYGDDEPSLSAKYMTSVNTYFAAMGVRGRSLLFAAGDSGVGGDAGCGPQGQFVPSFPADSPFVTAVGGTQFSGILETGHEVAWYGSGGGFSNLFSQPSWQKTAVSSYLSSNAPSLPPASLYNASGRSYPDVSAFATGVMIVADLIPQPVAGTSCASPIFSAVVSLVNGARFNAGKPSLGFLNPFIYNVWGPKGAFTDVTQGSNPNCNTNGFQAAKGWDPVTGWGTPQYQKMLQLAL